MGEQPALNRMAITALQGVGGGLAQSLARLGIHSVQDLLFHLPIRYLDRTCVTPIAKLRTDTSVAILARVLKSEIAFGRRRSLAVTIEDGSGTTCLRFYHFSARQKTSFAPGRMLRCYGDPRLGSSGIEFYHPEYEFVDDQTENRGDERSLTPVYGLTDGISQQRLRKLVAQAVKHLARSSPQELLPADINARFGCESLSLALSFLHFPPPETPVAQILAGQHPYQIRLALEELLAHFLARQQLKARLQAEKGAVIASASDKHAELLRALPFKLTGAQKRVLSEIENDLRAGLPMLRMVQGDVGSGKTLVAALTALDVATARHQVAVAAPTEILAEQHFRNFRQWLEPLGVSVILLVGKLKAAAKRKALSDIRDGSAQIIIGTHALFQEGVEFDCLGLAVIDEQHRFGVEQRRSLRKKNRAGEIPHQLVMTATPIPRTLAMTAYSELDYSVIDELPPGRQAIQTALISQDRREQVIARIRHVCGQGTQVYWVCPLVEDSEILSAANAEETADHLREKLSGLQVGLVHGRLKAEVKEREMQSFEAGRIQVLVATTVIEVGVDVPNASLMIIENPERLGLAQLHQLRGRVGRGDKASHCVLLYGDGLSRQARERLQTLRESADGFVIAEKDLQLRGPGELLGTRQAGDMQYRLADAQKHADLIPLVHELGRRLLDSESHTVEQLINRWIGDKRHYAQV